jgi:hypothetical protein
MRSIGNAVGLKPFRNTNRNKPLYLRKKNRIARKHGFMDAAHQAIFLTLLAADKLKKESA